MFSFVLKTGIKWKDISSIRNFVIALLPQKYFSNAEAVRVGMIVSELVENTCRYSKKEGVSLALEYNTADAVMSICVGNITDTESLAQFKEIYGIVNSGDATDVYKKMLVRSLPRTSRKQLGLVRIRYEGEAEISFTTRAEEAGEGDASLCYLNVVVKTRVINH